MEGSLLNGGECVRGGEGKDVTGTEGYGGKRVC